MKRILSSVIIIALLLFTWFIVTAHPFQAANSPQAVHGELDLTSWSFNEQGFLKLQGEWEVYDGQLLTPADFKAAESGAVAANAPQLTGYFDPTTVHNIKQRLKMPYDEGIGARTYRMVVSLDEQPSQALGMKLIQIRTSSELYINGKQAGGHGVVSLDKEQYKPDSQSYDAYFEVNSNQLELILQVANYSHYGFSFNYIIWLGLANDIAQQTAFNIAIDLCGAAVCFIIFMYHLYIAVYTRSTASLCFSLMFFLMSINFLLTGEMLIGRLVEYMPYEFVSKLKMFNRLGLGILFQLYLMQEVKSWLPARMNRLILVLYFLLVLSVLVASGEIFAKIVDFSHLFLMVIIMYKLWRLLYIWYRQRFRFSLNSVFVYLVIVLCWAVSFYNNMFFSLGLVSNKSVGSIAVTLFIILSQMLLAFRYIGNVQRTKRLDRVKEDFFMNTSYYLQAPLDSMLGITSQLAGQEGLKQQYPEHYKQAQMMNQLLQRMIHHVNGIRDLTLLKHDELKLHLDNISLRSALERAADAITVFRGDKPIQVKLHMEHELVVLGDEERVRQVLYTLIRQAANRAGTAAVHISVKAIKNLLVIHIHDDGEAISGDKQARLFDPDFMDDTDLGFNLFMTRELIQAMGGKLKLAWSEADKGTCFELSLQGYRDHKQQLNEQLMELRTEQLMPIWDELSQHREQQRTVLVVEDQYYNIQTLFTMLQDESFNLLYAYSGEEALHMLHSCHVDLVLMDIGLQGRSGIAVCSDIRKLYSLIELPIILMSVGVSVEELKRGFDAGANDYIRKPFLKHEIVARVKSQLAIVSSMELALQNELAFLQAQIEPHFIHNAINSVVSLCYIDPSKAAQMLTDFSQYLRLVFDVESSLNEVFLRRELELIEIYVNLERARFNDKYHLQVDVPPNLLDVKIPGFCIQPLVENAIKHGLYKKEHGGSIIVKAATEQDFLVIVVEDDGIGMDQQQLAELLDSDYKTGVGFSNIQKRIRALPSASMQVSSKPGSGSRVEIRFKYEVENG